MDATTNCQRLRETEPQKAPDKHLNKFEFPMIPCLRSRLLEFFDQARRPA
jgi:hypothetical protein